MPFPLIVIGAQKCGTATLTQDLHCCDQLWVDPSLKEDSPLLNVGLSEKHDEKIKKWFDRGNNNQIPVNISTRYSMIPEHSIDINRLADIFPECRILYIMREPLQRSLSHHQHDQVLGITTEAAEEAIHPSSAYVSNSLYGKQLEPWSGSFPESQIMLVKFEDYISSRTTTIAKICEFLGVSTAGIEKISPDIKHNVTSERQKFHPILSKILRSELYRLTLKRIVGSSIRSIFKSKLSGKNDSARSDISDKLTKSLTLIYEDDHSLLKKLHKNAPHWN